MVCLTKACVTRTLDDAGRERRRVQWHCNPGVAVLGMG
jgi:hypothetical protein